MSTLSTKRDFYFSVWRWHFYAGLFVVPFLIILSITGLLMMYAPAIEARLNPEKIYVQPQANKLSFEAQKAIVLQHYSGKITALMPPKAANLSSDFRVTTETGEQLKVFINPYTGKLLGDLSDTNNLYVWANDIHGTLLIGTTGDVLMELTAGFAILLTVTGLFLWWPRKAKNESNATAIKTALTPRLDKGKRVLWRDLHAILGVFLVVFILFFGITGLSWSGVWGAKLVQAWSTFPADTWPSADSENNQFQSDKHKNHKNHANQQLTHADLNPGVVETMPWNLEQTPLPISGTEFGEDGIKEGTPVNLDTVMNLAAFKGFTTYRLLLPQDTGGVYTLSANTMSGDIKNASQDRTMHIDQYTGKILADFAYKDYNLMAKSMAYGIALHSGYMDVWNKVINTVACLAIIFMCISGVVIWWLRRPSKSAWLMAPPMPKNLSRWKQASILMLVLALFFPLSAICIFSLLLIDALSARFLPRFKQIYQ